MGNDISASAIAGLAIARKIAKHACSLLLLQTGDTSSDASALSLRSKLFSVRGCISKALRPNTVATENLSTNAVDKYVQSLYTVRVSELPVTDFATLLIF
jgi:hypothetical protein